MSEIAVWWSTLGTCILASLFPLVSAELVLLGAIAVTRPEWRLPLAAAAATGQMIGKVVMYYVGRGAIRLPGERVRRALAQAEEKLTARQGMEDAVYFSSASLGLPPYYLVAVASGMVHYPLPHFVVLGFLGRFLRFAVLVFAPQLLKGWLPLFLKEWLHL